MKEMAKIPGLIQKRLTYFVRVRVPKDLKPHFEKGEVVRSLQTRDYSVAAKQIHAARSAIEAEFEKKRQQLKAQAGDTDMLSGYSDNELIALAGKWLRDVKAKLEQSRIKDVGQHEWSEEQEREHYTELRQDEWASRREVLRLSQEDRHDGMTTASEFLRNEGISYDTKSDKFRELGYFFSKAIHDLARQQLLKYEGKAGFSSVPAVQGSSRPQRTIKLKGLIEEYFANPRARRGESVLRNYRYILRAFDEVIGRETFVHEITRDHCQAISRLFLELPSNLTKKTQAKTLAEAVKIGKKNNLPKLSPATYNNYMNNLSAIMEYAVKETYLQQNPAKNLTVRDTVKRKDKRNPFTLEQLKIIFNTNLYTERKDDALAYDPKLKNRTIYARYWVPLISLWSGMRLNELCQLYVSDITTVEGVPVIMIKDTGENDEETEKRIKTENGTRFVPVHPVLLKAGLLDYVESVRKAGKPRVFPDLKFDKRGYYSKDFSRWFSRHLENNHIKTAKTSFHSFRHSYRDAIRAAKLSRDEALQLGGWSSDATDDDYGSGISIHDLVEAVCKIRYKGLELSHLYKL